MVAFGPLVSDNVHGPHQKALFEPGKAYPLSALTQAYRDAIWSLGMRKPTRDELFIEGKLD